MKNIKRIILIMSIFTILSVSLYGIFFLTGRSVTNLNSLNQTKSGLSFIKMKVDIPCQGHVFIIEDALNKIGVEDVRFKYPNEFTAYYDSNIISKEKILGLDIFKQYPAKEIK